MSKTTEGRRSRRKTLFWILVVTASVGAMIYWEFTALLYVISTLAMCALLLVVAFSKLEERDERLQSVSIDEEEVINSDVQPLTTPKTFSAQSGRGRRVESQRHLKTGEAINE
jgi:hypothetical protein